MHQNPGNALYFPPNQSIANSHLGANLVAALPGLDVDDLAHGLGCEGRSSRRSPKKFVRRSGGSGGGGVLFAGHEIELE